MRGVRRGWPAPAPPGWTAPRGRAAAGGRGVAAARTCSLRAAGRLGMCRSGGAGPCAPRAAARPPGRCRCGMSGAGAGAGGMSGAGDEQEAQRRLQRIASLKERGKGLLQPGGVGTKPPGLRQGDAALQHPIVCCSVPPPVGFLLPFPLPAPCAGPRRPPLCSSPASCSGVTGLQSARFGMTKCWDTCPA